MNSKTFKNLLFVFGFVFSLFYIPFILVEQVANLFGVGYTSVMLDGGFGDLLGLMILIYSVLFLSLGLGYKFSRKIGNVVVSVWLIVLFVSFVFFLFD
jgi:hypothetical protein